VYTILDTLTHIWRVGDDYGIIYIGIVIYRLGADEEELEPPRDEPPRDEPPLLPPLPPLPPLLLLQFPSPLADFLMTVKFPLILLLFKYPKYLKSILERRLKNLNSMQNKLNHKEQNKQLPRQNSGKKNSQRNWKKKKQR